MLVSIPPKYAVAQVVGFIKGKSAIHIARTFVGRRKNFTGQNFWARGYFVSTVGETRRPSAPASSDRKKIEGSISQKFLSSCHLQVAPGF